MAVERIAKSNKLSSFSFDNSLASFINSCSAASIKWIKKSPESNKKNVLIVLSLLWIFSF